MTSLPSLQIRLRRKATEERGATLVEYAVTALFIAVGLIAVVKAMEIGMANRIDYGKCTTNQLELNEPNTPDTSGCNDNCIGCP